MNPLPAGAVRLGLGALRFPLPVDADRRAVLDALRARPGVVDVVLAEATVAVHFDPLGDVPDLGDALAARGDPSAPTLHEVPARYDGPDLDRVARWAGLSEAEVVALHLARVYEVRFHGFVAGFAYLGEVDPRIAAPRLPAPRPRVPAGAVALAGARTAVYPGGTPGGWNLLGTALVPLPPTAPGDRVRFVRG